MARDAFLFYVDDWLSSGRIDLMDAHEERGYLRLLLRAWKQPDCGVPTDDLTLAAWSKMGTQWFRETADKNLRVPGVTSGQKVRACFIERNGRLFNERQQKEREYQDVFRERQAVNGRLGGRPKKTQTKPTQNPKETQNNPGLSSGLRVGYENGNPDETQTKATETRNLNLNLNLNQKLETNKPKPSSPNGEWPHAKIFQLSWRRHLKQRGNQPMEVVMQILVGIDIDWGHLESVHPEYCRFWDAHDWTKNPQTFLEWIQGGMLPPPRENGSPRISSAEQALIDGRRKSG